MKIGEVTYNVMKRLGMSSDDFIFSEMSVYLDIKNARNEIIKQEVEKGRLLDSASAQSLKVTLAESTLSDYDHMTDKPVFKSTVELPSFIDARNGPLIFGIYTPQGERILPVRSMDEYFINTRRRTYNPNNPSVRSLVRNKHLYIFGLDELITDFYTTIEGLYEDPEIVEMINSIDYKKGICPSMQELDFHCPGYIERRVEALAFESCSRRLNIPTDNENDGKDALTK